MRKLDCLMCGVIYTALTVAILTTSVSMFVLYKGGLFNWVGGY